ncbi:MAG: hypothetical protein JKX68_01390 [Flavobacteriales bacterium]|nr:hypothetical protein [Flavobacteriales bacterium]
MLITILTYLAVFYLSIIGLMFIGHIFYCFFIPEIEKPYQRIFSKASIGVILFTIANAIYKTNGHTILILFLLILAILVFEKQLTLKKDSVKKIIQLPSKKTLIFFLLSIILPGILFFSWEALFMFKTGNFNFVIAPRDYHHYSNISEAISITGQENTFGFKNLIYTDYHGVTPYHYFELWFTNGITNFFDTINIVTLMTICYPIFYWITYLGICAIWECFGNVRWIQKLLSFLFIGLGGLCLQVYEVIPYLGVGSFITINPIETFSRKYIIYYPFVIASWLFFYHKKKIMAMITILCLPIIFIGSAPAIFTATVGFTIITSLFRKIDKKTVFRTLLYTLMIAITMGLFYILNKNPLISLDNFEAISSVETWKNLKTYKTILNIYILTTAQYLFYFLPFIVLIMIFHWKSAKKLYDIKSATTSSLFLTTLFFTSLSSWAFLHLLGNANQFFSNGIAIVLNVWLIALLIKTSFKTKHLKIYASFLILIISPNIIFSLKHNTRIQHESDQYLLQISNTINNIDSENVIGGILFSKDETTLLTEKMNKAFHIFPLAHYTNYTNKVVDVQNLSAFDVPSLKNELNEKRFKRNIETLPFFRFVEKQKKAGSFHTIEKSHIEFINTINLRFLVVRKEIEIPSYLSERVEKVIEDSKSGDRFLLLNNKQ